jgi:hypothetical protein
MIKTLRITIIVTAILAVVFFVLSAAFGLRRDKDKEAFLAKPSATAVFKKNAAGRAGKEVESPLVKQAQTLALRINPPKPREEISREVHRPVVEVPQFRLLGTSFCPPDPNKSMALIDEPGKGVHWVMASDKINYLTIVKVEDGKIEYTDGKKTIEMAAEKPQGVQEINVIPAGNGQSAASLSREPAATATEQLSPAEEMQSNVELVKQVMAEANSASGEAGITGEEANDLKGLGEFLKRLEEEQKQLEERDKKAVLDDNAANAEPNSPSEFNSPKE